MVGQSSAIWGLWIITNIWLVGKDGVMRRLRPKEWRIVRCGRKDILRKRIGTLFVSAMSAIMALDLERLSVSSGNLVNDTAKIAYKKVILKAMAPKKENKTTAYMG